jgi:hypothetical protein
MEKLSLAALNSAMDDYESVNSVRDEIANFLGEAVSEESLFAAFRTLEGQGLVEAHRANPDNQRFVPTNSTDSDAPDGLWFLATEKGRQLVEREWHCVFP